MGLRVVHVTAGHLRLSVGALSHDAQQALLSTARALPGVRHATLNSLTGNMLVRFDPAATDASCLLNALCGQPPAAPRQRARHDWALRILDQPQPRVAGTHPPSDQAHKWMLPLLLMRAARVVAVACRIPGVQYLLRLVLGPVLAEVLIGVADLISLLAEHGDSARAAHATSSLGPAAAPRVAFA
jgi:hypothetical protein